jgi:hypothetical protein
MDSSTTVHAFVSKNAPATGLADLSSHVAPLQHRRLVSLQAGLAEMMLLNRLRARTRRDLALDMLQRSADVIALTAAHWFATPALDPDGQLDAMSTYGNYR